MTHQSPDQLGVCSWSLLASSPQDLAQKVQALGVNRVQLALTAHREDAGVWDGVSDALAGVGAKVVSGMFGTVGEDYSSLESIRKTGGVVPDEHWEANQQIAKASAIMAKQLGLTYVSIHAGFLPHDASDPAYQKLLARIVTIAGILGEHDLIVLFETGQEDADSLWQFMEALDAAGATNTGINFDPANMILYDKGDPVEALRKLMPRVNQVHLKDAIKTTTPGQWGQEVVVGQGQVDWPAFMRVLNEAEYAGDLVFEREAGDDRVGDIAKGIAFIKQLMG